MKNISIHSLIGLTVLCMSSCTDDYTDWATPQANEQEAAITLGRLEDLAAGFTKVDEDFFDELEETLIMGDVGANVTMRIMDELRDRVRHAGITEPTEVIGQLREIITGLMGEESPLDLSTKPSVVLVIGVNGVGKTTTIGKMAAYLRGEGKQVLLAAADTFRAAAAEQLAVWADRAGAELIRHEEGSDPASVVFDAIHAGKSRGADVIICDTAGRLHNKKNLMDELSKIARVISRELPDAAVEVLLVLDATTGQNAISQARSFQEAAGITGIVLTKLDGTAKGGAVIGIREELGVPVKFIGVGEGIDDLRPFVPAEFAAALFEGQEL